METRLTGDDARIWSLHSRGFPVSGICSLVGMGDGYVRSIIRGAWRNDMAARKGPEGRDR